MRRLIRWLAFAAAFPQSAILYHNLTQSDTTINLPMLGEWSLNSLGILLALFIALEMWRGVRRALSFAAIAAALILLGVAFYGLR